MRGYLAWLRVGFALIGVAVQLAFEMLLVFGPLALIVYALTWGMPP